jgi:hypothetical protein
MPIIISSRTPEGRPGRCPVCESVICIEPSAPAGDAPCPCCGQLLWFVILAEETRFYLPDEASAGKWQRLVAVLDRIPPEPGESLDLVELVMELEEELGLSIPEGERGNVKSVGDLIDLFLRQRPDQE